MTPDAETERAGRVGGVARRAWPGIVAVCVLVVASASWAGRMGPEPALVYVKKAMVEGLSHDAIWMAGVDGSHSRLLTRGFAPRISPDGRWVAFERSDVPGLYLVGTSAGASPRLLARGAEGIVWSPDARHLAASIGAKLVVIDIDTGALVTIDRAPRRLPFFLGFGFSPSGGEVVWARPVRSMGVVNTGDVFRASAHGGPITRVTRAGRSVRPVWGPKLIAFASFQPGTVGKPFDRPFQIWAVRPDGGGLRRVSGERYLVPVAWSKDGARLLACYLAEFDCKPAAVAPDSGRVRSLYRATPNLRQQVDTRGLASDGRSVLVTEGVFEGPRRVSQIPYAGGPPRVIVRDADSPDWNR